MEQGGPSKKAPYEFRGHQDEDERRNDESPLSSFVPANNQQSRSHGIELVSQLSVMHQAMHQTRQSSDESRMNLLRSALGQGGIDNVNEAPSVSPHQHIKTNRGYTPLDEEEGDSKPAAKPKSSPQNDSSDEIQENDVTIRKLLAEKKALQTQLEELQQDNRQLRQTMAEQNQEALERHNALYARVIQFIQSCEEEKRQRQVSMRSAGIMANTSSSDDLLTRIFSHRNNMKSNQGQRPRHHLQSDAVLPQYNKNLASSLLQSSRSASEMLDAGDSGHRNYGRQEQRPFSLGRDDDFISNAGNNHMMMQQDRQSTSSFGTSGVGIQAQLENLERQVQALKRQHQDHLDDEVEQRYVKKRRRGEL